MFIVVYVCAHAVCEYGIISHTHTYNLDMSYIDMILLTYTSNIMHDTFGKSTNVAGQCCLLQFWCCRKPRSPAGCCKVCWFGLMPKWSWPVTGDGTRQTVSSWWHGNQLHTRHGNHGIWLWMVFHIGMNNADSDSVNQKRPRFSEDIKRMHWATLRPQGPQGNARANFQSCGAGGLCVGGSWELWGVTQTRGGHNTFQCRYVQETWWSWGESCQLCSFYFRTTDWAGSVANSLTLWAACCFPRRDLEILQWLNTHRQEAGAQWTAWHVTTQGRHNHISGTSKRRSAGSCESLLFTKRISMWSSRNTRQHRVAFPNPSPKLNLKLTKDPWRLTLHHHPCNFDTNLL